MSIKKRNKSKGSNRSASGAVVEMQRAVVSLRGKYAGNPASLARGKSAKDTIMEIPGVELVNENRRGSIFEVEAPVAAIKNVKSRIGQYFHVVPAHSYTQLSD